MSNGRPRETVVDVRGLPVFLRESGTGPTILFLHGPEEPAWPPALARLAREFRVVAPDHPGMGQTPLGDTIEDMDDLVYHYVDLMNALGLRDVTLVGVSFGGWIAAEVAVPHSHHLGKLVLVDADGLRVDGKDLPELYVISEPERDGLLLADPRNAELAFPATSDPERIERRITQWANLARFTWQPYWHNPKLPGRLHHVNAPTLIVWGAEDRFTPPSHAKAFAEQIPKATVSIIPGAGHLAHLDQPDRFTEVIRAFVKNT